MRDIWVISDQHLGHKNFLNFLDKDGNRIRKFDSVEDMDEYIVQKHNSVVRDQDLVYFLGDVFFNDGWKHIPRLKGHKRLILGNHDDPLDQNLMKHFQKVMIWRIFKEFNCVLSHIPLHDTSINEKVKYNIHGHIHEKDSPSERHINACVEKHDYTPVHIEEMMKGKI